MYSIQNIVIMKKILIICSGTEMSLVLTETGKTQMKKIAREIPVLFNHQLPLILCGNTNPQKDSAEIVRTALAVYTPSMASDFLDVDSKHYHTPSNLWAGKCIDYLTTLSSECMVTVVGMQLSAMLPYALCKHVGIPVHPDDVVSNIARGQAFFIDLEGKSIRRFMN